MDVVETKWCHGCERDRPLTDFYIEQRNGTGRNPRCSECCRKYFNSWYQENPERAREISRRAYLKRSYNMTPEAWDVLLQSQQYGCAICGTTDPGEKRFHVDHDHTCCPGKRSCGSCVRGLLCNDCNTLLARAGDNPDRLRRAADYLERRLF